MNSLSGRLLAAASVVLIAFVLLLSLAIRHSVHARAEQALYDRLQGMIYGILGAAELDDETGQLRINTYELPEQQLQTPSAGLYAEVLDQHLEPVWQSSSTVAQIPELQPFETGSSRLVIAPEVVREGHRRDAVRALQFAISWSQQEDQDIPYYIQVVNNDADFRSQLDTFDKTLMISLSLAATTLLGLQLLILHFGLRPLRKLREGIQAVENHQADSLDTDVPTELKPLARSINTLLHSERNRQAHYRNVMDDLAHSLKTPLSIMQNLSVETGSDPSTSAETRTLIANQTERMRDIVDYHLKRAADQQSLALTRPTAVQPILQRLVDTLTRVYPDADVRVNIEQMEGCTLRINEADLMEILGNILDNSFKFGATRIDVSSELQQGSKQALNICDNGPGVPEALLAQLTARGVRADAATEGQGLGLALCRELTEAYGGSLQISNRASGGVCVAVVVSG